MAKTLKPGTVVCERDEPAHAATLKLVLTDLDGTVLDVAVGCRRCLAAGLQALDLSAGTLKTETETREVELDVKRAARELLGRGRYQTNFEHGQWWVTELGTGAQWSAHDASGRGSAFGFCFEQVTQGNE